MGNVSVRCMPAEENDYFYLDSIGSIFVVVLFCSSDLVGMKIVFIEPDMMHTHTHTQNTKWT